MAPSRTPGRNKREADYSNIGVAGRKTGITLKDSGIRDEHGLEPIEGIFSSPKKSPIRRHRNGYSLTVTEEEGMEFEQSTMPEPMEVLSTHRLSRDGRPLLPPPRARSPMKTSLGSSPRRSMGPMSSPTRSISGTPSRRTSHPMVNRKLDFSIEEPEQTVAPSPKNVRSLLSAVISRPKGRNGRKRTFDLGEETDVEEDEHSDTAIECETAKGVDDVGFGIENPTFIDGMMAPDASEVFGEEATDTQPETEVRQAEADDQPQAQIKPKSRGRPRKKVSINPLEVQVVLATPQAVPAQNTAKRRAGRPKATSVADDAPQIIETEGEASLKPLNDAAVKPRRGRKPKDTTIGVYSEGNQEAQIERSPKRQKLVSPENGTTPPVEKKGKRKGPKPPPSARNPNARITSAKSKFGGGSMGPKPHPGTLIRTKPRSLFISRGETPAEDDGASLLKSGRTSVRPLAFWRNERIVYGEAHLDGNNLDLPAIKEIIRTEEILEPRPKRYYRRPMGRPRSRPLEDMEKGVEDDDQEDWELAPGILRAEVMQWDPSTQRGVEDTIEEVELALAPVALQALTREVKGAEFTYAKTLTLPFFHSGMVDLPPSGVKRLKNSRKNHMVFWVFYGRVRVEVAGIEFSIGKGGMWQVPRGNFYSITNQSRKPARIFFAQGCYMTEQIEGQEEDEVGGAVASIKFDQE